MRVLVVDDEPGIRSLLFQLLSRAGNTVDVAGDGTLALEMVARGRYDALIIDLKMPGISGEEVYRRLREMDRPLASRVIFITGDTIANETRAFVKATGNPLIEKPFDLVEFRRQFQSLYNREYGDL